MFGLKKEELVLFKKLNTPIKIQDFLDTVPINYEKHGDTHYSPRTMLIKNKAHCIEGALFAAAVLWSHGEKPLLMDFTTKDYDEDHVIALYKRNGYWGAISKTNHPILRFRDPVYRNLRELALSYFHEYFMFEDGKKTLVSYSLPLDMRRFGVNWVTESNDLWWVDKELNALPHSPLVPKKNLRLLRNADSFTVRVESSTEWKLNDPRT